MTPLKKPDKQPAPSAELDLDRWRTSTFEALVEHILSRYHDSHREQLPELVRLAQRVERVHGNNPHAPAGLSAVLESIQEDLEAHMHKEETILFPMIVRGVIGMAYHPVEVMRGEHDRQTAALAEIDRLTRNLTLPEGACRTWTALYQGLGELKTDLFDHIELENGVLFARVEGSQGEAHHG
ncbi:hemerythrin domain-containing protein [Hydrocarboniclastica marina]|uniref:Hemerythrin-like domain-containing protein n=1 Tax=Hydrocarboniclastica marina TaxID=2259620 RepID=A0A4V1D962_9ALTE|nr:hemerythrin domain-containing protein [Hydrocarboniclastica marina]MAM00252.1 hypothetical protein [Alteromonadaceae bacterium]QCF27580.1 hypothetical protein soil367_17555 [Hydrocarboniclastica marina]|tara:strand:+ start:1170 stop:1715 length:546 start_codon:yes stop_codon:yes gene_type:complete